MSNSLTTVDYWFLTQTPELTVNMDQGTFDVKWHNTRHHRVTRRFPRMYIEYMDDFIMNIYEAPDMRDIELPSDRWHTIAELHAIQRSILREGHWT